MRRGNLNKKSLSLILLVAFFTIISYVSDQWIIRTEDDQRKSDIKYQLLENKIKGYDSLSDIFYNISMRGETTFYEMLLKRNYPIKKLVLLNSNKKDEYLKFFTNEKETIKKIKWSVLLQLFESVHYTDKLNKELFEENKWNKENLAIFTDTKKLENFFSSMILLRKIFDENKDELIIENLDIYENIFSYWNKDFNNYWNQALSDFSLENWFDVSRINILLLEKIGNNVDYLNDLIDEIDKEIEKYETKLNKQLEINKKIETKKNYLILFSILSQVLALLFLLLLFRSFLINQK